jgi:DNA-directed RNA polymerase
VCALQPDLLQDLLAQLQAQHPGLEFPPIPERGQLSVHRVRNSRYFFS